MCSKSPGFEVQTPTRSCLTGFVDKMVRVGGVGVLVVLVVLVVVMVGMMNRLLMMMVMVGAVL